MKSFYEDGIDWVVGWAFKYKVKLYDKLDKNNKSTITSLYNNMTYHHEWYVDNVLALKISKYEIFTYMKDCNTINYKTYEDILNNYFNDFSENQVKKIKNYKLELLE